MQAFGQTRLYHQAQRMLKEETFILPVGSRQDKSSKAKEKCHALRALRLL
jgi:hypothetical protein